jgi:hypothetical protein
MKGTGISYKYLANQLGIPVSAIYNFRRTRTGAKEAYALLDQYFTTTKGE